MFDAPVTSPTSHAADGQGTGLGFGPVGATSVDSLEQELVALEGLVGRVRARQAELVDALDRAQVTTSDGCRSIQEWVAGRLDVAPSTARDLVAVTRGAPPMVAERLGAGVMSFDRAVATTRLAAEGADDDLLEASEGWDIGGVRRLAAKHRRLTPAKEQDVYASRSLSIQPSLDNVAATLWATLTGPDAAVVLTAITNLADGLPARPDGTRDTLSQRQADALVSLCAQALRGPSSSDATGDRGPALLVTTDLDALVAGGERDTEVVGGLRVGLQCLEEIFCNGTVNLNLAIGEGRVLAIDSHQPIPPRIRQHVLARDGACTAAGCRSRHRLQVHHIIPRSQGGTHHLTNLTTLCWYHHHVVVHGQGYTIDPQSPPGRRRFLTPTTRPQPP